MILSNLRNLFVGTPETSPQPPENVQTAAEPQPLKQDGLFAYAPAAASIPKQSRRDEQGMLINEDAHFTVERGALGVFDGVASAKDSHTTAELLSHFCKNECKQLPVGIDPTVAEQSLKEILQKANDSLNNYAKIRNSPDPSDSPTDGYIHYKPHQKAEFRFESAATITAIFENNGMQFLAEAHAGDGRVYVVRDGAVIYQSLDHRTTSSNLPVRKQQTIQDTIADMPYITLQESSANKNLTYHLQHRKAVGGVLGNRGEEPDIRTSHVTVKKGDIILVLTDGVHDNLTTTQIEEIVSNHNAPQELCDALTDAAEKRSRTHREETLYIDLHGQKTPIWNFRPKPDDMTAACMVL